MLRRVSLALATIAALSLATACTSATAPSSATTAHDCGGGTGVGSGGRC